ncbi:hypothetical protein EniyanLRS_17 [Mycobacterium phage EniyanLRS]|uniref:Uncharacterized protein n=1 Tax=Mycobacterium phage EniyanLRS TaxID=1933770 RepID=A0A2I2MPC3_9CAUD|nr:hypothetical protein EniyanLRS_17 [Mycobacterium phage EniyanLRS]
MTLTKIRWRFDLHTGNHLGVGEHASYVLHQLTVKELGRGKRPLGDKPHWMVARKVGDAPLKIVGGPYETVEAAKAKAERMEPWL